MIKSSAIGRLMKLAIFDFDGTLFTVDTLPCLGREWKRQGRSWLRYLTAYFKVMPFFILYKAKLISRDLLKVKAMAYFHVMYQGMTRTECELYFKLAVATMKPSFDFRVIEEFKAAQEEGFHTVLLSGAYANLLRVIGDELGIGTVIGAELPFKEGIIDHRRPVNFIDGQAKLALLQERFSQEFVDWSCSRSYADSLSDLPVLEVVGEPVVVNPEPELLTYAINKQWRVIQTRL